MNQNEIAQVLREQARQLKDLADQVQNAELQEFEGLSVIEELAEWNLRNELGWPIEDVLDKLVLVRSEFDELLSLGMGSYKPPRH